MPTRAAVLQPHAATVKPRQGSHDAQGGSQTLQRMEQAAALPTADQRQSLPFDAPDLHTTLNRLDEVIEDCRVVAKNAVNQGTAEIHFTCSIKKTSVVDTIFRCKELAERRGSKMPYGLAWYDPDGGQAGLNIYGPHITISSTGKQTQAGKVPIINHHIFFKFGATEARK